MNYKIFSCTNFKYVDIAEYWADHMQRLGLDYTVYCTDKTSFDHLLERNIKCDYYDGFSQDNFDFTQFGLIRFKILEQLLEQHDYVIYSDIDAIWIDNPLIDILGDQYAAHLSTVHHDRAYPSSIREKWGCTICTGWMGFRDVCKCMISDFINAYHSFKIGNDQQKFNEFLYSIYTKINNDIDDNSFTLETNIYNHIILGLPSDLIHRGNGMCSSKVIHPLTQTDNHKKLKKLKTIISRNKNLWMLK